MALTISINGSIVAYADGATTDTGGGAWGELGAGTVGDNPDVYLYGSNSFASKYASKSGRTYYQDDTTRDYTVANNELMYVLVNIQSNGAFRAYATGTFSGSFNLIAGSSTGDLYHWNVAAKGASNGWTGGWKAFVIDPNITTGTEVEGTPNLAAVNTYGVWIDTDVSVRADSVFQSMIISATGATVVGSPTLTGGGFDELAAWCTDYTQRAFPLIEVRGSTYFQKGGIVVGDGLTGTVFSARGNTVECEESSFFNGTAWVSTYPATANYLVTSASAAIDFNNVTYSGYVDNKLYIDLSDSLSLPSSIVGGSLRTVAQLSLKVSDTLDGVVLSDFDQLTWSAGIILGCTFTGSRGQALTITIYNCKFNNNHTDGYAASALFLSNLNGCEFTKPLTTSYAAFLGAGTFSQTWNCTATGYIAGTAGGDGVDVAITGGSITGNETIYIDDATTSNIYTISVSDGATIPSVATAGCQVYVIAGQKQFTVNVSPLPNPDYEYRLYTVTAEGSLDGAVEIAGAENHTTSSFNYTHTYSNQPVAVQIISNEYVESITYYTLTATDLSVTVNLQVDNND